LYNLLSAFIPTCRTHDHAQQGSAWVFRSAANGIVLQKSQKALRLFFAKGRNKRQSPINAASESPASFARGGAVPHTITRSSGLRLGEFESHAAKRVLQHYQRGCGQGGAELYDLLCVMDGFLEAPVEPSDEEIIDPRSPLTAGVKNKRPLLN
jgi:hypothetical protein